MNRTLEQLKAMPSEDLCKLWANGVFPFDFANCGCCVTQHAEEFPLRCKIHHAMTRALSGMKFARNWRQRLLSHLPFIGQYANDEKLAANIEALYALRLFYDHLYPACNGCGHHHSGGECTRDFPDAEIDGCTVARGPCGCRER